MGGRERGRRGESSKEVILNCRLISRLIPSALQLGRMNGAKLEAPETRRAGKTDAARNENRFRSSSRGKGGAMDSRSRLRDSSRHLDQVKLAFSRCGQSGNISSRILANRKFDNTRAYISRETSMVILLQGKYPSQIYATRHPSARVTLSEIAEKYANSPLGLNTRLSVTSARRFIKRVTLSISD